MAVITREAIRLALRSGITAAQIVRFLRLHTHAQQTQKQTGSNTIPLTVVDQIYLWEKERNRFEFTDGVLYNQFLSHSDYALVRDFAQSQSVVVWFNDAKRTLIVTRQGHDPVKKFWKRHSRGAS